MDAFFYDEVHVGPSFGRPIAEEVELSQHDYEEVIPDSSFLQLVPRRSSKANPNKLTDPDGGTNSNDDKVQDNKEVIPNSSLLRLVPKGSSKHKPNKTTEPEVGSDSNDDRLQYNDDVGATHNNKILTESKGKTFPCIPCNKDYQSRSGYIHHIQTVHEDVKLTCSVCGKCCSSKIDLRRHWKRVHDHSFSHQKRFKCRFCAKCFINSKEICVHMNSEHPGEEQHLYTCSVCAESYFWPESLDLHKKLEHKPKIRPICLMEGDKELSDTSLRCAPCKRDYQSSAGYNYHMESAHGVAKHHCQSCGKSFAAGNNLLKHLKYVHNPSGRKKKGHKCNLCVERFSSAKDIVTHIRTKHPGYLLEQYHCPHI